MGPRRDDTITAIRGLLVGHWTDTEAATGCTVVLCPEGAVASADIRGGAPATRETDLLRLGNLVDKVHAVLLSGGSAYGLDAAAGVMRWLEERGKGRGSEFPALELVVPIVVGAALFDLFIGRRDARPDAAAGYAACQAAADGPPLQGSVGAGTGATVAKALGPGRALKGGIGSACEVTEEGVSVGALVAPNSFGEVVDPDSGQVVAGPRGKEGSFADTFSALRSRQGLSPIFSARRNTTIGVVATDAALSKEDCYRMAVMAQAGLTRVIRPAHTPVDGDAIFALATGARQGSAEVLQLGALAARAVERAILRAVTKATGLAGVPSAAEWAGAG